MAYITKVQIQEKRKLIKQLCKAYGVTATVSGSNSSAITVTISEGIINFLANHVETVKRDVTNNKQHIENAEWHSTRGYFKINHYCIDRQFSGIALDFMEQLLAILENAHSDTDVVIKYFYVPWHIVVKIGDRDKPYEVIKSRD